MKQFLLPENPGVENTMVLTGKDFHYLVHVRRFRPGQILNALSPDGRHFRMEILSVERDSCPVALSRDASSGNDPAGTSITLIPAITRGKKMDLTVRQAVEAGSNRIWPIVSEHCQMKFRNDEERESKRLRWERIAREALQQCGGGRPAEVAAPTDLHRAVDLWARRGPLFVFHEKKPDGNNYTGLHRHLASDIQELAIMVGPEGGFSNREIGYLHEEKAVPIWLGSRVLRAETAALYALAAISTILREKSEWLTL